MKNLILIAAALLITGCQSVPKTTAGNFCDIAKPIYWADGDTDETILQAKEHNAVGKSLCGWGS